MDLARPGHGTGSLFATGRNTSFSDLHVVTGRGVGGGAGKQGAAGGARPRPGFRRVNTYDVPDSQDIPRAAAAFHRSQTLGSRHVRVAELQTWLPKRRNDWREGSTDSAMPSPQLVRRRSSLSRASSLSRSGSGVSRAQTRRIIRRRSLHGVPSHVYSRGLHGNRRASPTLDASGRLVHPRARAVTSSRSPVAGLRAAALAHFADPVRSWRPALGFLPCVVGTARRSRACCCASIAPEGAALDYGGQVPRAEGAEAVNQCRRGLAHGARRDGSRCVQRGQRTYSPFPAAQNVVIFGRPDQQRRVRAVHLVWWQQPVVAHAARAVALAR